MTAIELRDLVVGDLDTLFDQQLDAGANFMAAFTANAPADRAAFDAHWQNVLKNESVVKQLVLADGAIAGYFVSFEQFGKPAVGYWIGTEFWGRGIATAGLRLLLQIVTARPIYAHAATDNAASIRVLEKCGFVPVGNERAFANARNAEIDEVILELR